MTKKVPPVQLEESEVLNYEPTWDYETAEEFLEAEKKKISKLKKKRVRLEALYSQARMESELLSFTK